MMWMMGGGPALKSVFSVRAAIAAPRAAALLALALRSKSEARGQVLQAQSGALITLEGGSLRVEARVKELELSGDSLSFERATIELAAWRTQGTG